MVEAAEGNPTTWKFTQYVLQRSLQDLLGASCAVALPLGRFLGRY
jgi:hypothetical protein